MVRSAPETSAQRTIHLRSPREVYSGRLAGEIFGVSIGFACLRKRHLDLLGISLKQTPEILCLFADHASSTLPAQQARPALLFRNSRFFQQECLHIGDDEARVDRSRTV